MAGAVGPGEGRPRRLWKWTWAVGAGIRVKVSDTQNMVSAWGGGVAGGLGTPLSGKLWPRRAVGASDLQVPGWGPLLLGV